MLAISIGHASHACGGRDAIDLGERSWQAGEYLGSIGSIDRKGLTAPWGGRWAVRRCQQQRHQRHELARRGPGQEIAGWRPLWPAKAGD
jgi:hypothetical protein